MTNSLSQEEIIKALERSGYLFESETAMTLAKLGFFVETNQPFRDPITYKTREIDIIAEYHRSIRGDKNSPCKAKIRFIFELKNNIYPIVLLTKQEFSPNISFEEVLKQFQTFPPDVQKFQNEETHFEFRLLYPSTDEEIFTQYCSFQRKKATDELMAIHPEELYSGLSKIAQCAEYELDGTKRYFSEFGVNDNYYRNFLYLPVVLINGDLFEQSQDNFETMSLRKVESARFFFNYHFRDTPQSTLVYFVTKAGLSEFLSKMLQLENEVEDIMISHRLGAV